jgi:hypothetical protein
MTRHFGIPEHRVAEPRRFGVTEWQLTLLLTAIALAGFSALAGVVILMGGGYG